MKVLITTVPIFERNFKHLAKHYASFKEDYSKFLKDLHNNPFMGVSLGNKLHKVRMAIASKGKGKSGGARVITYTMDQTEAGILNIRLLDIYDKSERSTLTDKELDDLVKACGL